jgi:hypothetical protein
MDDTFARVMQDLIDRVNGAMNVRLLLQPAVASIVALRDGLNDARHGQPPYIWSLLAGPTNRM